MTSAYHAEKAHYRQFFQADTGRSGKKEEIRTTPLFSLHVKHNTAPVSDSDDSSSDELPQYGLLGHHIGGDNRIGKDEPILLNVHAPNSAFICGSQGSGKSYTLSAMLENCLLRNNSVGFNPMPVAGVVFHYDVNSSGSIAEVAYLCSTGIKVDVLVSPSNQRALELAYGKIDETGNLSVRPLLLRSSDLSIDRMHKLMALSEKEGPIPLYMEVVQRILRQMAISEPSFDYESFRARLAAENLTRDQTGPLSLRLGLLESFLEPADIPGSAKSFKAVKRKTRQQANLFQLTPGTLTIIDLSDTFIDASTVCMLFDICLGLVQEQRPSHGLVVALDEAHKFMNKSAAATNFTDRLLTTIREQRHNATRVYIATQEPTISDRLLDLCSMSIVHRFTSPAWFGAIKDHLGGASKMVNSGDEQDQMFQRIVELEVGESLVFAPSSYVAMEGGVPKKLGPEAMKMKTRKRSGVDGGASVLTTGMGKPTV